MTFLWLLEGIRTPFLDKLMQLITYFGQELIIIAVICVLYWCADKRFAYLPGFTYFTAGLCVQSLKITFRIPRPWILDPDFTAVTSAVPGATGYSFPSGHTQGATCLFFPLALKAQNIWFKILCILAFLSIGFSRMYLGVHTPLDVFTSLLISTVMIFLLKHVTDNYTIPQNNKIALLILAIAYALGLIFYSLLLVRWNISTVELTADSIIFACSLSGFAIGSYVEDRFIRFGTECLSIFMQFIKIFLGLGGMLLITKGFSLLPLSEVLADSLSGFFSCIWATCIFPLFIRLVQKKKYSEL